MTILTPGIKISAIDISLTIDASNNLTWTEWKRTFCLLPRKDITGRFLIGLIWYRMQESHIYEYEDDIGYYVSSGMGFIEYARTKKDIFLHNLNGE